MELLATLKRVLPRLTPAKIAGLGALALLVLLGVAWIASRSSEPMGLLYAGLDPAEAGRIGQKLEEMKVPFQVGGDGDALLVPQSRVARVRMDLAAAGYPHQTGAGYELLDSQSPMNMTSFMQRVQRLRALEGELARTIVALDNVRTARVHLVLPERDTFSRYVAKPTASVAVVMAGGGRLSASQAAAIRLLVAGAVPGLQRDDVSVLDPSGIVLAAGMDAPGLPGPLAEAKRAREAELESSVTGLLEPLVGRGKVRVVAAVDLDTSREVERDEKFDPNSQVERSKQIETDQQSSDDSQPRAPVTVAQNLPNQPQAQTGGNSRTTSRSAHNGQTVNYEISSVRTERVQEPGSVRRVSVAVVVDGMVGADGKYTPRPQQDLDRLAELVKSAIGFDAKRGDKVTVEAMRFVSGGGVGTLAEAGASPVGSMASWTTIAGVLVLLLAGGGVLLFMRKSTARPASLAAPDGSAAFLAAPAPGEAMADAAAMTALPAAAPAAGAAALAVEQADVVPLLPPPSAMDGVLSGLNELIDARPDEALAVIRAWIADGAT